MCLRLVRIGYQGLVIIFFDLIITTDAHLIVLIILTVKSRENFIRWKGVAKIFIRSKGVASHKRSQDFWLGGPKPQIAWNDVIRNLQKRNFLWGKDIVEWKIWSCSPLTLNQNIGEEKGRKLIVGKCKSNLGDVLSKLVYSNVLQRGVWGPPKAMWVWGQSSQPLGDFYKFLEKKAILIPLDHISHVFKAISKN